MINILYNFIILFPIYNPIKLAINKTVFFGFYDGVSTGISNSNKYMELKILDRIISDIRVKFFSGKIREAKTFFDKKEGAIFFQNPA